MSKTIIVGDLHLGGSLSLGKPAVGEYPNSKVTDRFNLLNWILTKSIENHVDRIILTGDVFEDYHVDPLIITSFISWLRQCSQYEVEVHIVTGNHEIKRVGTYYKSSLDVIVAAAIEGVTVYSSNYTLHTDGCSFVFLPFRDRRALGCEKLTDAVSLLHNSIEFELSSIPATNKKVCVGHYVLAGAIFAGNEIDDVSNEIVCPLSIFQDFDYVWMGHVHKFQQLSENPYIGHTGSLDLSDFGEAAHKKQLILIDSDSRDFYTLINVPTRPLRRLKYTVPITMTPNEFMNARLDDLLENDPNYFEKSIVRIELSIEDPAAPDLDRDQIKKRINEAGCFHFIGFSERRNISVIAEDSEKRITNGSDPKEALKLWCEAQKFDNKEKIITLGNEIIDSIHRKNNAK